MTTDAEGKIKGLGLTRDQLKAYLKARVEQGDMRPMVVKEMYTRDDEDYTLVTENTPRMVVNKLRTRLIEHSLDLNRTKPLITLFREDYNLEMVSLLRKGRLELLGALQMLTAEEEGGSERPVNLGGR
jgi:hypothetical protein